MKKSLLAAALVAGALWGCTVPSLETLEAERPRACDEGHGCLDGYTCIEGACQPVTVERPECTPGTQEPCGSDVGACEKGTRACGEDGTFGACIGESGPSTELCNGIDDDCDDAVDEELAGPSCNLAVGVCAGAHAACVGGTFEGACTAASFGADYEQVETTCDGKDNDCDGSTDEMLTRPCEKQLGVCAGANVSCSQGRFPTCIPLMYTAHDARYEALELSCDGADNDCDGQTDAWSPVDLSASAERSAWAAAVLRDDGSGVVLYEEGPRIRARPLGADGEPGAAVAPSDAVYVRAFSPAVATHGTTVFAAWIEEFEVGRYRVMLAPLGPNGQSTLIAGGKAAALAVHATGTPVSVALAASATRLLVVVEDPSAQVRLQGIGYPTALPPASSTLTFSVPLSPAAAVAQRPAVLAEAGHFFVAWESSSGIDLRRVKEDSGNAVPLPGLTIAGSTYPQLLAGSASGALRLFSVRPGGEAVDEYDCPDAQSGSCTQARTLTSSRVGIQNLRVTQTSNGALAGWDEGAAATDAVLADLTPAVPAPVRVDPEAVNALRPVPLRTSKGAVVVYDTETSGDDVMLQRLCL